MKRKILLLLLAFAIYSCSLQNFVKASSSDTELLVQIFDSTFSKQYDSFEKKELLIINHSDTLIEQSYSFVVPTGYTSFTSSLNSLPTVHCFSYPQSQYIILLLETDNHPANNLIDLDIKTIRSELRAIGIDDLINLRLSNANIKLKDDRLYSIIKKDSIIYLVFNYCKKSQENTVMDELKQLVKS